MIYSRNSYSVSLGIKYLTFTIGIGPSKYLRCFLDFQTNPYPIRDEKSDLIIITSCSSIYLVNFNILGLLICYFISYFIHVIRVIANSGFKA